MEMINVQIRKTIGQNIKKHRIELGLTQTQLANRIGNNKTTIADVESGRTRLYITNFLRYAKALECKPEDLLEGVVY